MKVKKLKMALLGGLFLFSYGTLANTQIPLAQSKTEVTAFVDQALEYLKTQGEEVAMNEFNNAQGLFNKGKNYIFVMDFEGKTLANPSDPSIVGQNIFDIKDIKGRSVARALIEKAKYGGGWVSYYWKNPENQKIECKTSYVVPFEDKFVIGSGLYHASHKGDCHKIS